MKNHLLIISTMYPSKKYLSFGTFVKNQVDQIKEKGYDVELLVIKTPKMGKIKLIQKYSAWLLKWLYLFLKRQPKYNLVHAHYVFPSGLLGLLMKKLKKIPLVVTAHGGDLDKMARKNRLIHHLTKQILQEADHVIAVGEKLQQQLVQEFKVKEEKLTVLNMGVDRSVFQPLDKQRMKQSLNLPINKTIILFVGNIIQAKGLEELLQAYNRLANRDISLYIIGEKKEPYFYRKILTFKEKNNLKNIHLLPPLPQKEIAKWMNAADLFILPSHMEGFGLVALEAMSCHTPVIGSYVGGLKYLLADHAGISVERKNSEALKQAIEKVFRDEKLQELLITNGEKKAKLYDKENIIKELLSIYRKVM